MTGGGLLSWSVATASLPALPLIQIWQSLGWGVVAAALTLWLLQRWAVSRPFATTGAALMAVWMAMPGVWGGHYGLGLAFQAPSVVTVLWAGGWLCQRLSKTVSHTCQQVFSLPQGYFPLVLGVMCGWILLFDTLGVFSISLYNWGFSALAPAVALFVLAMPWAMAGRRWPDGASLLGGVAIVLFVSLQLPTGNVFDALLDPFLWVALQFALVQTRRRQA